MNTDYEPVRHRLETARCVAVLTGAGISADSGVPTFRGKDGLWRNHRPEELATPGAFEDNPRLVWAWYNWRREIIASKSPNPAHHALGSLEQHVATFTLMTQNVDGLHALAGSRNLVEIHGNLWKVRCTRCGAVREDRRVPLPELPVCETCGGLLRPHVVWFGESLDPEDMRRCDAALRACEVLLVIGTSGVVQPAASFAWVAKDAGALVVEINRDPTPNSGLVDFSLLARAAEAVPRLLPHARSHGAPGRENRFP